MDCMPQAMIPMMVHNHSLDIVVQVIQPQAIHRLVLQLGVLRQAIRRIVPRGPRILLIKR